LSVQLISKISNLRYVIVYRDAGNPPTLQTDERTDRPTDGRRAIARLCFAL